MTKYVLFFQQNDENEETKLRNVLGIYSSLDMAIKAEEQFIQMFLPQADKKLGYPKGTVYSTYSYNGHDMQFYIDPDCILAKFRIVKTDDKSDKEIMDSYTFPNQSTQLSTPKKSSTMAKFTRVKYNPKNKNNFGKVVGTPYDYVDENQKRYTMVPEKMVTLNKGNNFIIARKHQTLSTVNPKTGQQNIAVYVMGYSNLEGTTSSKTKNGTPRRRRVYFVARQIQRGGTPALALFKYYGYDQLLAKEVFKEIAYSQAWYLDAKTNQFKPYSKSSMTAAEIVKAKVQKAKNLEAMKTKAYGNKEARRQWANQQYGNRRQQQTNIPF